MKLLLSILAVLNGGYMLLDGIYVMLKGKYIGPEKPGPWASIFAGFNIDPFKLGPLFIVFGLLWTGWLVAFLTGQSWAFRYGLAISLLTLWYLPVGTLFSLVILVILIPEEGFYLARLRDAANLSVILVLASLVQLECRIAADPISFLTAETIFGSQQQNIVPSDSPLSKAVSPLLLSTSN